MRLKRVLKSKAIFFLSNMLRHSAITIDGIKMMHSPLSHLLKISLVFCLIFGLLVKCQRRAWVSVRKFILALNLYPAIKRLLGFFDLFRRYFNTLEDPFKGDDVFLGRRKSFKNRKLQLY